MRRRQLLVSLAGCPQKMTTTHINAIATAVPPHEAHQAFLRWADVQITDRRDKALFRRMATRSGIDKRWSVLAPADQGDQISTGGFYGREAAPSTAERMRVYAETAPGLCVEAARKLRSLEGVTHLVLASCTGFIAPGIDQIVARALGLSDRVERTLVGFMGCYAAVVALRTAHHIVRSQPDARVLVLSVELCTLHLQPVSNLERILAMMLFGDGAAAAIVSARPEGLAYGDPFSFALPDSAAMITWTIADTGFEMELAGAVPARIGDAATDPALKAEIGDIAAVDCWAVHAGGRTVLDAVERGFGLDSAALMASRDVLHDYGNMSSATLLFVLARLLTRDRPIANGVAIAFGPGLVAEGFHFQRA